MRSIVYLIMIAFCGCVAGPVPCPELDALKLALRAETAMLSDSIAGHSGTLKEHTAELAALKSKAAELESKLLQPEPVKEVIAESNPAPDRIADARQHPLVSSDPEAVVLWVSNAPFPCPPCEKLKRDVEAGKFSGFEVRFVSDWTPSRYPAIRYKSDESATGYAVKYGYDQATLVWLKEKLLGEKIPFEYNFGTVQTSPVIRSAPAPSQGDLIAMHNQLHGGGNWTWPGDLAEHLRNTHGVQVNGTGPRYSGNQVYSSRNVVRSVSRGPTFRSKSNFVSRNSCPTGTCP